MSEDSGIKEADVNTGSPPKTEGPHADRLSNIFACLQGRYQNITTIEHGLEVAYLEREVLTKAFGAAEDFIASHVADPDITDEMCRNYEALNQARNELNWFQSENIRSSDTSVDPK